VCNAAAVSPARSALVARDSSSTSSARRSLALRRARVCDFAVLGRCASNVAACGCGDSLDSAIVGAACGCGVIRVGAFACNYNRVATLQHGDGTDATKYDVPSNAGLGWPFHHLSHRVESDSQTGMNSTAEQAHAEIDVLRMKTLLHGLDAFSARGLFDKSVILWTNHVADGPSHSFKNVPHIVAGDGGGYLKQGAFVDAGNVTNNKLFNTLIAAATRDKNMEPPNFGRGSGSGQIDSIRV
jgi:hypothetical protein